jgi:hypothetical protein
MEINGYIYSLIFQYNILRSRCRWEDYNKMGIREIEWEVMDWSHVAQDRNQ